MKSRTTPRKSSGSGSETDSLTMPRSGLMCEALMDGPSLERWALSLPDFPASLTASPDSDGELMTSGIFGQRRPESLAKFDPATSTWRTSQASFLGEPADRLMGVKLQRSLPRWVMWDLRELWQLVKSALPTGGKGGGYWPTPMISTGAFNRSSPTSPERPSLGNMARFWPIPKASAEHYGQHGLQVRKTSTDGEKSSKSTRQLNPRFVEWLMGIPIVWTALEPLGMESYRQWRRRFSQEEGIPGRG